jgi:hypothetical protein
MPQQSQPVAPSPRTDLRNLLEMFARAKVTVLNEPDRGYRRRISIKSVYASTHFVFTTDGSLLYVECKSLADKGE